MFTAAKDKALSAATSAASSVAPVAAAHGARASDAASSLANAGGAFAMNAAQNVAQSGAQKAADIKKALVTLVLKKCHKQIEKLVDRMPAILKDMIEDPDMPRCVSRGKDRVVNTIWPDVKAEIMFEVAAMLDGVPAEDAVEHQRSGPDCFRAFFRWHIFPYNKSIWGKLRDPVFIIFKLVSMIPLQGVCPAIFFFMFLLIDKKDEFQLIFFILQFKGTQFISHGLIRTIVGFFMFINCVSVSADESHTCDEAGPGAPGDFIIPLAGFLVQVVLVWTAFFLLPCSTERGRAVLSKSMEETQRNSAGAQASGSSQMKGGYIIYFLFYDLVCAFVCFAAVGYVMSTRSSYDDWPVRHALYAAQVVYGYLSMPFFIFTIPLLQNFLTHAVPTGYDPQGRCHKLKPPESVVEKKKERARILEEERLKSQGVVDDEDTGEFLARMKSALGLPDAMLPDLSQFARSSASAADPAATAAKQD